MSKEHKNVFYIEDPDDEDLKSPDLVAPVIIHRVSDGSDEVIRRPKLADQANNVPADLP